MRENLTSLLDDFRRLDGAIAVVRYQGNRRRVTTYAELARLAGRFAALLERRGVAAGDRVLLWGENSAEWIAAFYGCMLRGVLAVPLDANGTAEFARRVTEDVKPKLALGDALLLRQLVPRSQNRDLSRPQFEKGFPSLSAERNGQNGARDSVCHPCDKSEDSARVEHPDSEDEELDFPRLAFEEWLTELPEKEAGAATGLGRDTPLQILFTSGTTGDPKGIVLTHGNVLASLGPIEEGARPYMRWERLIHPLRILHTLPLSHVFGQTMGLWIPPILRAELHFENRLAAPRLIQIIREERISVLATVPRVLAILKAHLEAGEPKLAGRLEQSKGIGPAKRWWRFRKVHRAFGLKFWAFVTGGGALAGPLEQFWNALGFVLVQGYGMTETTALITLNHPFHVARGTIGKPVAGRDVKLGPDGEVLVRGPMISAATWQGGKLQQREDEWLATGDLAERQESGELKFLGRKSEVIVTASGVNLHPEDMEAAVENQPGVAGCAVVPVETAGGPEPCAVLAVRGAGEPMAAAAIESANGRLAEFQKIRRWVVWPEPDLPRTSTGKVKRKAVADWLTHRQAAPNGKAHAGAEGLGARPDWLLALIAQVMGETPAHTGDEARLTEDLHLDSLARVQLASAIEQQMGIVSGNGMLEEVGTLGDLRRLVAGLGAAEPEESGTTLSAEKSGQDGAPRQMDGVREAAAPSATESGQDGMRRAPEQTQTHFAYPTWPWWKPVAWMRIAFIELVMRPLVWFLANPRVSGPERPLGGDPVSGEPMLIVANHVTAYDAALVEYALTGRVRRHIAAAMLGEMLEDFRHWRNPERAPGTRGFYIFGPAAYFLVTALFNVFPLPRLRDFQSSFFHAGKALDHGYNVLVFPEGTRSAEGKLARFRPGIGLLVKQSDAPVLPVGIRGLGELKAKGRGWFRSGKIEVQVGEAIRFAPEETEAAITERLHAQVGRLMGTEGPGSRE
ncbi:MAG TPA: AMP-binding protein [Terracidiphilus sp.]|nr:AMP-binding protein [Terracidiphilus sp.]